MKFDAVNHKYNLLTKRLIKSGLTISTCESCTSGQIASLITDTEGSSSVFKGAFVTYSNESKVVCGVPKEIEENYGIYSGETSIAMANAAYKAFKTDIAIGVTGTFGNVDPNNSDSNINHVFFTIINGDKTLTKEVILSPSNSRREYKYQICEIILDNLNELLDA